MYMSPYKLKQVGTIYIDLYMGDLFLTNLELWEPSHHSALDAAMVLTKCNCYSAHLLSTGRPIQVWNIYIWSFRLQHPV